MNKSIEIPVNIDISDKDIERLEKTKYLLREIKQILQEIKEIDSNFSLSNVIDTDKESILIVTTNQSYCKHTIDFIEKDLKNRIGVRCVLIPEGTKIEKAINIGIDYAKGRDYTTITYYNYEGKPIKEETIQYK